MIGVFPNRNRPREWPRIIVTVILLVAIVILVFRTMILGRRKPVAFNSTVDDYLIVENHREMESHGVLLPTRNWKDKPKNGKYAYISLICDDSAVPQARVLAYSWKRVRSEYPLVFLTLPFVQQADELLQLGAEIERIPTVPAAMFKRPNGKRPAWHKLCRYSKIHAWNMTRYEKATFIDTNLLLVNVTTCA